MVRSFLSIVLISLISLNSARSEDFLLMNIGYCLDSSTLILKGSIVEEDGGIQVEAVLKGAFPSNEVRFHELRDINEYGDYSPEIKVGWEVIIFLKTSGQHELVPVMYWDNLSKALGLGVSTLWLKDGNMRIQHSKMSVIRRVLHNLWRYLN